MDAADDLKDDLKEKKFNPFISKLGLTDLAGGEMTKEQRDEADRECNAILNGSLARLLPAMNLLPQGQFSGIITNVLEKGLPEMQREILFLHIKEKSRRASNRSESI